MMTLLANERALIGYRIKKLIELKETAGMNREIVIAAGVPILKEHEEEFKALDSMYKIIQNNMKQNDKNEYLELRDKTKLPSLEDKEREFLTDPEYQKKEELRKVETRLIGIETKYFTPSKQVSYQKASNGKEINLEDIKEYENLLRMKEIIQRGFSTKYYYEYLDLRDETRMPTMDVSQYEIIMGSPALLERKKKQEVSKEPQELAVRSSEELAVLNSEEIAVQEEPQVQEQGLSTINNNYSQDEEVIIDIENLSGQPKQPSSESEQETDLETSSKQEEPEDFPEIEVVNITPLQKIAKHKKKILIGLGVAAITVAVLVAINGVLPAYLAAQQASNIAGLASQMVTNSTSWFAETAAEKLALHSANHALASAISSLTGMASNYTASTGVWTIGAETLTSFVSSAATAATAAAEKAAILKGVSLMSLVGGLSLAGAGFVPDKENKKAKKSKAYLSLKSHIDKMEDNIKALNKEDQVKLIQAISNRIIENDAISNRERDILHRKLRKIIRKNKIGNEQTLDTPQEPQTNNPEELMITGTNPLELENIERVDAEIVDLNQFKVDKSGAIDVKYIDIDEPSMSKSM